MDSLTIGLLDPTKYHNLLLPTTNNFQPSLKADFDMEKPQTAIRATRTSNDDLPLNPARNSAEDSLPNLP